MPTMMVRYEVTPDAVDENVEAIEKVLAELAETRPAGLSYSAYRLDDGVTFVHVAELPDEGNPLQDCAAFAAFQRGLPDRLVGPPSAGPVTAIGHHRTD